MAAKQGWMILMIIVCQLFFNRFIPDLDFVGLF